MSNLFNLSPSWNNPELNNQYLQEEHKVQNKCSSSCSLFSIYTQLSIQCSLFNIYTQLSIQCSLFSIYTQLSIQCSMFSIYTQLSIQCSLFSIYTQLSIQCSMFRIQCLFKRNTGVPGVACWIEKKIEFEILPRDYLKNVSQYKRELTYALLHMFKFMSFWNYYPCLNSCCFETIIHV